MLASAVLFLWLGLSGTEAAFSPARLSQPEGYSPKRSTIPAGGGTLITMAGVGGMLTLDGVGVILVGVGAINAGHDRSSSAVLRPKRIVRLRFVSHRGSDCHVEGGGQHD
jgi:hypothetical protein